MMRTRGFTLVELLVVIAIISILASIVVPRVGDHIAASRAAKAVAEIRGIDLAATKLLADSGKSKFGHFWTWNIDPATLNFAQASKIYTDTFYELLRKGRQADISDIEDTELGIGRYGDIINLKSNVLNKLGTSYMDINMDPWGEKTYQFFVGPLSTVEHVYVPFRAYRGDGYLYNQEYNTEQGKMRGNPPKDTDGLGVEVDIAGYPAPRDLPLYVYSLGENMTSDQGLGGGGDDINNWDTAAGWDEKY